MNTTNPNATRQAGSKLSVRELVFISLITAILCILAPFSIPIPFSPVPITLTNFVLYISIYLLGYKKATISCLVYLLLGVVGLPVFSGFSGGLSKLAGPTGGYLIGFIFLTFLAGLFVEKFKNSFLLCALGMILGTAVCYLFGTLWLSNQLGLSFSAGLAAGVIPYLPGDAIKIIAALILGPMLSKRLHLILCTEN